MTGVLVNDNTAENGPTGAIGNAGDGAVIINSSTVENNSSGTTGGGFGDADDLGTLTVSDSLFHNNTALGDGGGIQEGGPSTTIASSVIRGNSTNAAGGGVFANGTTLTILNSTISDNLPSSFGGGGVEVQTTGTAATASTIADTTIVGNSALNNAGNDDGGGIDASANFTGTLTLLNDTINGNYADSGGGVFWSGTVGAFDVQNTILAGNRANIAGPDANNPAGTFNDMGGNLIGVSGAGSGNTGFTAGTTQTGTVATPLNPLLGAPQYNGGPVVGAAGFSTPLPTEAPRPHSKAIDKGVASALTSDERGFPRPDAAGEKPDVGAYETQVRENFTFVLNTDGSLTEVAAGGSPTMLSPAGTIAAIASATDDAGFDVVFAITSNGQLWEHNDELPGDGWEMLSAGSFLSLSAAVNDAGDAVVVAVPTDHSLWENTTLVSGGWVQLSPAGTILSASAATDASQGFPQEVVYAITVAGPNNLWEHTSLGWQPLSSGSFQSISAGFNSVGQTVVYAVGTDDSLTEFNPALGGGSQVLSGAGTILSASAGAADQVFAVTADHHLWSHTTAAGWSLLSMGTFESISGGTTAAAGVGEVFGVLSDGSLWEYNPALGGDGFLELLTSGTASASTPQRY